MTFLSVFLLNIFSFFAPVPADNIPASIYDFKVEGLRGETIDFAKFKGKKIMIVNTASECGYTPQYADLQATYEKYKDKLVIVGFPANDFGKQEPGSNQEIEAFCKKNYGVTFPMAAKITVKGDEKAPIYVWLTEQKYNKLKDSEVKWNFQKYLINEKGELVAVFPHKMKPTDAEIVAAIER
ncbi:MAG: glutathione peroxidase [Flavipsychrobacter sp.]|jgi:glutathione peroxidase|nr:glutathione peroxidase [Flavipsychrobacter sp.]